ncbi:MAG TPA: hypothetical protein VHH35_21140 [Pyrinomonadaceae bacterium]|nr:hypothetical protein [Pyrinomonadaceae bacterium]
MKSFLICTVLLLVGFGVPQSLRAQTAAMPDEKQANQPKKRGGVFTMYALDPLARTLCFSDGKEGMQIINHQWDNRCSDLSYSLAGNGSFITGVEQNRVAAIADLGTANELRTRYGFEDADNGGVGFASLRLQGGKVMVLQEDIKNPVWQPLQENAKLFGELGPSANAPIKLGHIYVLRIADTKDKGFQQIVKLMVIAYRPDEAVTLRWELMQ